MSNVSSTRTEQELPVGAKANPIVGEMVRAIARRARKAARELAVTPSGVKNAALRAMAAAFRASEADILEANAKDLSAGREHHLSAAMLDRLDLGKGRVEAMARALEEVADLDDPVGEVVEIKNRPNGLRVGRMRSPLGVIGIIYESRPNVTADAGCLCVKSGNAVILRGGSEAIHSNEILARLMEAAGAAAGLPAGSIQFINTTDRAAVKAMLQCDEFIDIIIPRGGKGLIEMVMKTSHIPVIKHLDGNCFIYVDESADLDQAIPVIVNSKTQRTGVCNALESLLIHESIAAEFAPRIVKALEDKNVIIRADESIRKLGLDRLQKATPEDWRAEYLDLILTVGTTPSLDAAIDFINEHSSHHTESILTTNHANAMRFLSAIDSACVFINASTRFSDGGEFGLGCEIGISTDKLHARGPMGLRELTNLKWIAFGEGQIRA